MKDVTLLLCAVFCVFTISLAAVPRTQAYTLQTTYAVEIHGDGTASWVIEQSAYLGTDVDQANFEQLISRAMVYIDQFTSNVSTIIEQAHARTGRFMTAENITVGGNVTERGVGAYGFLDYSFDWTDFAAVENASIAIGDVFSNESFIFGDGGLSILIPIGYIVKSSTPSPDHDLDRLLEWNSVSNLRDGQPTILLSKTPEGTNFLPAYPVLFEVVLPLTVAVLASLLVLRTRKRRNKSKLETFHDEPNKEVGDTERILALLRKEGGQTLQSKITEQLKFSKAKTSVILGRMESGGFINRHKSGRDKVVSLQKEPEKTRS
jgi:hypothetical protein